MEKCADPNAPQVSLKTPNRRPTFVSVGGNAREKSPKYWCILVKSVFIVTDSKNLYTELENKNTNKSMWGVENYRLGFLLPSSQCSIIFEVCYYEYKFLRKWRNSSWSGMSVFQEEKGRKRRMPRLITNPFQVDYFLMNEHVSWAADCSALSAEIPTINAFQSTNSSYKAFKKYSQMTK